eukprot:3894970-Prymnesium_polylepis.1
MRRWCAEGSGAAAVLCRSRAVAGVCPGHGQLPSNQLAPVWRDDCASARLKMHTCTWGVGGRATGRQGPSLEARALFPRVARAGVSHRHIKHVGSKLAGVAAPPRLRLWGIASVAVRNMHVLCGARFGRGFGRGERLGVASWSACGGNLSGF